MTAKTFPFGNPQPPAQASIATAIAHFRKGEFVRADKICALLLASHPQNFDALYLRGMVASAQAQFSLADELLQQAARIKPQTASLHSDRGMVLQQMGKLPEAVACYRNAMVIDSTLWSAYFNCGIALHALGKYDEAITAFDTVLRIKPDFAAAWNSKGMALKNLGQFDAALAAFKTALEHNPRLVEAYCNLGNLLQAQSNHQDAIAYYQKALDISPLNADALCNMGAALRKIGMESQALVCFDKAIHINPQHAQAHSNRGILLIDQRNFELARPSLEKALAIKPDIDFLLSSLIRAKMSLGDWTDFDYMVESLAREVSEAKTVSNPFAVLALIDSPALQKQAAQTCVARMYAAESTLGDITPHAAHDKIRIGYFSADFHDHATAYLMAQLFELHDRDRFEIYAFSFGAQTAGSMRERIRCGVDHFLDVADMGDIAVARLSRTMEIDIAVDLKGLTAHSRPKIFAYRAAPVQAAYLGYPGTMGAPYMDYLIADEVIIPKTERVHYCEKVVYVPNSYQVNDSKREISAQDFGRAELGLPATGFVYCCFNGTYKITPRIFDRWMRILQRVEGSVLWLLESNQTCISNLRTEATRRGVAAERLIFAGQLPLASHLARYKLADLFLDTTPCNAHTTASDALWAGVPVLTCLGDSFASRVAGSLVLAVGMPELIADSWQHYEEKAIALGLDAMALTALRQTLETNKPTAPLFDCALFARNIETVFQEMYTLAQPH